MKFTHDVIVIGAGAAGLTAAGGCALFGLKVALIEADKMGGECLNNGCVPSKALITAAKRAAEANVQDRFGIQMTAAKVNWAGVHAHIHNAIAEIAPHDSEERFEEMGCDVYRGHATFTGRRKVRVGEVELAAPKIVIATGSEPFVPTIEGLGAVPYLTNENIWDLDRLPQHLVIVGGGVIGMEMAQSFRRLGSEVTVIEPGRPMGRDDPESVAVVVETMEAEGVMFVTGKAAKVVPGALGSFTVTLENGQEIAGTHLLVAVGRKARTQGYGLEEIGVELGRNGIAVDQRRRTNLKHIYAIGDCREGPRLTHVSGYEGSNVALEITTGLPTKVDWSALPWCTYTEPEVAQIGMTEAEAREKHGDKITVIREGFDHNERAIAEGATKGHMKVVMDGKKVLGASIVGKNAGELLLPFSQLISGKASTFALGSAIVAYPTRSEITKAAAFSAWEGTVFGSVPRGYAKTRAWFRKTLS
ncbi:dihydrolipoyl dehydrogenase family protein [Alteriqipengyuania lutimaris]|uniref:FAD-binding protein n=1 Tax=Alteriqipengyuania lutimaris TaxID=1538146 RepID=A0A395LL42_9SPHN|nr:FAD-dependent oxidoreductase [Alteriqipengyuania lutimaris]MBB3033592.1 pyruvate/2-oxoglutarate dehydrogenase complex dihydrolipoamide dehydrogenase (E3) component [Alteriqipengyuania lutimaris]RDS77409.1 FAD-binding protein [Alteriqipengyuania lutimaris]